MLGFYLIMSFFLFVMSMIIIASGRREQNKISVLKQITISLAVAVFWPLIVVVSAILLVIGLFSNKTEENEE